MPKQIIREKGHYWIKNDGYDSDFTPIYFNGDSWKIALGDKYKFVSDHVLKSLYGKDCIERKVDYSTDVEERPEGNESNAFYYVCIERNKDHESEEGYWPILFNEKLGCVYTQQRLMPFDGSIIKGYITFKK